MTGGMWVRIATNEFFFGRRCGYVVLLEREVRGEGVESRWRKGTMEGREGARCCRPISEVRIHLHDEITRKGNIAKRV
jgi:hypothetical protein